MSTGARSEHNAPYFQAIVPGKAWALAFTNSPAQGPVFESSVDQASGAAAAHVGTTVISMICDQDCWISIGANPTASNPGTSGTKMGGFFLPAGIQEYVGVNPGDRLSVIRDTANGTLYVNEGA